MKKTLLILLFTTSCVFAGTAWQERLEADLPVFGHRNWIVIADSAYPKQSAEGIETIYTDTDHMTVVKSVLEKIESSSHVQAIVLLDKELDFVPEDDAPGIGAYRKELKLLLNERRIEVLPHEEIIAQLDKDSDIFSVLILKTRLTIPYTSVFLKLDCGYWGPGEEARLRKIIENE